MTKITGLEQKIFQGKPSGWKIIFDDGRSGYLHEKESSKGLRAGDTVDVKEIPYTSKAGVQSTLYVATLVGAPPQPPSSVPPTTRPPQNTPHDGGQLVNMRFEARMKLVELAHSAFLSGKLNEEEAIMHFKTWVIQVDDMLNELFR